MTAGPGLRWGRGALLAAAVVGVSASAHTWAGGGWPPGGLAFGAWLVLAAAFASALGREAGLARIAGLQLAGQAGFHGLLALAHPGHGAPVALSAPTGGHLHSGSLAGAHLSGSLTDSLMSGGWAMLLAHLAAAAVLTGWLLAGERAVWSLIGALASTAAASWARSMALAARSLQGPPGLVGGAPSVPAGFGHLPAFRSGAVLRVAPRRGPPAPAAA